MLATSPLAAIRSEPTITQPTPPAAIRAAAALSAYLGEQDGKSQSFRISQGVKMGRPSLIEAAVTVEDGKPVEVRIAGHAVKVMEGRLAL